ncbi:MAG: 23S rRNA (guanosine(2251)-2'-O)-methyltransferase RlmB [Deltaproteobacteria bacterium]|nr:23S rRNA (guanosine(2251)-2'-O)-methyltransferase RlmB [Deltaproteobacteria bacterium]MBW2086891.1 23S rRNA (guanosine(2251)-2'-O)-methyltransferase RlmB [Deltaproteobacteria bacterium]
MSEIIGGLNSVLEALRARADSFERIYMSQGRLRPALLELFKAARAAGIKVTRVERSRLDQIYDDRGHQGVVARIGVYRYFSLEQILDRAKGPRSLVLILDGIQDPMNLGSLLRSAEAAGSAGVILPRERAAPITAVTLKASAGAAEHVAVARVVNLVRVIEELKQEGFWVLGAHQDAEASLYDQDLSQRLALVVGGEGKGLRRLVAKSCDCLVSIPLRGQVSSLNAAVAGALAMFEYVRQTREQK